MTRKPIEAIEAVPSIEDDPIMKAVVEKNIAASAPLSVEDRLATLERGLAELRNLLAEEGPVLGVAQKMAVDMRTLYKRNQLQADIDAANTTAEVEAARARAAADHVANAAGEAVAQTQRDAAAALEEQTARLQTALENVANLQGDITWLREQLAEARQISTTSLQAMQDRVAALEASRSPTSEQPAPTTEEVILPTPLPGDAEESPAPRTETPPARRAYRLI